MGDREGDVDDIFIFNFCLMVVESSGANYHAGCCEDIPKVRFQVGLRQTGCFTQS